LKGVHHAVNAFGALLTSIPDAEFVVIGRVQQADYVAQLKGRIRELGIEDRVRFVGEIPQVQLAERMAQATVLMLPSLSEGLGRVVIEAMATGIPVIGSSVGGIPEIIQDGRTGFLVPPGDEGALEEKMRWVVEHPADIHRMGAEARKFAKQFFSQNGYVMGYHRLIAEAQVRANYS
jgi:glycosyltransferase involved in cell wall biosynthesis